VQGCIAGERVWQFRLYETYSARMLGVCLRYSKNREDAEEILHEGFLRVFRYIHQFHGKGSLQAWIRMIMINCALLRFKKNAQVAEMISLQDYHHITDETDILAGLGKKEMLQSIQKLPTCYRMVFNLYVFEGYKHREIAEILGISEGTSKSNLHDAKLILKKTLLKHASQYSDHAYG
jgi:RNA polymerase sigma-70 factor (ECF subfamily)